MASEMTSKQRILKALEPGEPDKVPVFEMGINEASIVNIGKHFTDQVPPIKHVTDMDLEEQLRYMDLLSLILKELGNDGISTVFIIRKERVGEDLAKDKYGTTYHLSEVGEPVPVEGPVQKVADIAKLTFEPDPGDYAMLQYLVQTMGKEVFAYLLGE